MIDKDPNHLSRPVREGKSMGEFGTTDTTRTEGKQGWKVKKQIRIRKLKNLQVETKQGWEHIMEESGKKSFRKTGLRYGATLDRINDSRTSGKIVSRSSKKKRVKRKK